jgi:hypothetical protein
VTLPDPAPPRDRWLTRSEAAALIRSAWRYRETYRAGLKVDPPRALHRPERSAADRARPGAGIERHQDEAGDVPAGEPAGFPGQLGYCREMVAVTLPDPAPPRDRWLTRSEAAALIRSAWRPFRR